MGDDFLTSFFAELREGIEEGADIINGLAKGARKTAKAATRGRKALEAGARAVDDELRKGKKKRAATEAAPRPPTPPSAPPPPSPRRAPPVEVVTPEVVIVETVRQPATPATMPASFRVDDYRAENVPGDDSKIRLVCQRCGQRFVVTRHAVSAPANLLALGDHQRMHAAG